MWNCPNNSIRGSQLKTFAEILDLTIAFPDSPLENWNNKLESLNTRDNSLWQCQRFFRKKRSNIPSLTSSSGVANSDDQKANILASTLQNNFSENKRPGDGRHPIDQEITNTLNNFFDNHPLIPISPTEPDEILNYIKSLKNNKAPGSDLITNKMAFSKQLEKCNCFSHQKPNKNAHFPDSYRPISHLSILSKITEYVILNRLKSFTNDNNFINPNQYGFARNLSTYHPLLGLTEKITAGFQRGRSTGAVFLDIQKAFDRVWGRFLDLPFDLYQRISATNREPTFTVPPTNHSSAIQTIQDFTAETVCKKISVSVATPPCHVRPTNQDTHSQAGPPT
ncbi:probable RNA-directed DNA polymerase from transposon BS [Trichonephila clavipes]|nr:probable RNA-directed DNA polymerase from transposon BS [Trichonephila clavipes]